MSKAPLTPEDSLKIINNAISNFKVNYKESSKVFLLWGWALTLASFSNFIILKILQSAQAYELMGTMSMANWVVFVLISFAIQIPMLKKLNKDKKVIGHLDGYVSKLWQVSAVGFFVAAFICIKLEIAPPPFMLLIAAIATTTSGLLIKFKPLVYGGIAFFIFSIAQTFITNEYIALINGLAIICGYLIPGYLLKSAKED